MERPTNDTDAACALRVWMARYQISCKQLATMLSCHPDGVSDWRLARGKPDVRRAVELERVTEGAVPVSLWVQAAEG